MDNITEMDSDVEKSTVKAPHAAGTQAEDLHASILEQANTSRFELPMQREISDEHSQSLLATSPTIEPLQSLIPSLSFSSSFLKKSHASDKLADSRPPEVDEKRKSRSFLFNQLKEQARLQEAEGSVDSLRPV